MSYIYDKIKKLFQDSDGATAVEYGVLIALIIAVSIAVILVLGDKIAYIFCIAAAKIGGGDPSACIPPGSIPPLP